MKSRTKPALRALPAAQVQISLPVQGVLRDVRHAFLGLCIDAGQKVLTALMESARVALCGAKGVPDAQRRAVRGGSTASRVVLGGQRIAVRRPRARSLTEGELPLPSFEWAANGDPLEAATMAAIAAGVSTRRYASTQEPVAAAHLPGAASKSAVSRRFVQLSQEQLAQWLARPLGELELPVVMIDGIHFRDRVILLVLGIDAQGNKHVLGLREGSSEATRVVASLLSDLIDRGLDAQRMRLWVIDGGKALRKANLRIELVPSDDKVASGSAGSVVYWSVPKFAAALRELLALGAVLYRGPMHIEHGQSMCQVQDPWGNCIGLRGPVSLP
jgi:putative transposase